jgi:hypothetical protein
MALARKRLAFSTLKLVLRSSRYHRAARRCSCARERFAWVTLKYAPLLENALRSSSLIPRHSCNSLALIVALACNSPVHTHRALIVPHRRSSYQASCVHPRSNWRSSCVRRCSSMLMLENALRVCYAQVRSLYAPLQENALRSCAHRRSCLQQP